ncbi:Peptidase M28, partial [Trinorchestia longiramus]
LIDVPEFSGYMEQHLTVFSKDSHPRSPVSRNMTQDYIRKRFELIGLQVEEQTFNTSVLFEINDVREVQGTNIIGILEGSSYKNLMVIGAHYDSIGTTENHYPERDNGVGIATLIEVARALDNSIRYRGYVANYTTIFVAFDLNTREEVPPSPGMPGSEYFVKDWLEPKIKSERRTYRGSFILDSIATYNTEENSQNLPADFKNIFPEAYQTISDTENKGNFLAAVSLGEKSKELLEDFEGHYNYDKKLRPFRLQKLIGDPSSGLGTYGTVDMFDDQASFDFWSESMPSVLLTDTGDSRSLPTGEQPTMDTHYVFWNPERQAFVQKTYQALSYTILDSQTTYIG